MSANKPHNFVLASSLDGFTVEKKTTLNVLILQSEKDEFDAINAYLIKLPEERKANTKLAKVANEDVVEKGKFGDPSENYFSAVVQPGKYVLIPCTFDPKNVAKFSLHVFAQAAGNLHLEELTEGSEVSVSGEWTQQTAGGCLNDESAFRRNQQYRLEVRKDMVLQIRLRQLDDAGLNSIGFYILKGADKPRLRIVAKDILNKSSFGKSKDVTLEVNLLMGASPYLVVPCTFNKGELGEYKLVRCAAFSAILIPRDLTLVRTHYSLSSQRTEIQRFPSMFRSRRCPTPTRSSSSSLNGTTYMLVVV